MQLNTTRLVAPVPEPTFLPTVPKNPNKVMFVGDVPYDENSIEAFTNSHYGTLGAICRNCGFEFDNCVRVNLLPFFPKNGKLLAEHQSTIDGSVREIERLIKEKNITCVVLLGDQTIKHFKPNADYILSERGAPFKWRGTTCIATLHPKELFIRFKYFKIVMADVSKAARLAEDGWTPPEFDVNYKPTFAECVNFLQRLIDEKPFVSMDLETQECRETGKGYFTCCGFGLNAHKAFVIPFLGDGTNKHYFSIDQEMTIWRLLAKALESAHSLGQNAVHYDHWYAAHHTKILINVRDDAMFAHWENYCEHEKSLAFQASIYTDFPYHKDLLKAARSGKVPRDQEFYYNGLDCCYNFACAQAIGKDLNEQPKRVKDHYRFNILRSRVFEYMSIRGARINVPLLEHRKSVLEMEAQIMEDKFHDESETKYNVRSPKQMKDWLYKDLKLPKKYKTVRDKETGDTEDKETADFLAFMYLAREFPGVPGLNTAANLRLLKKRLSSLNSLKYGPDGKIYWNFNAVGTDSGRAAGYKPYCGLGFQPQNFDRRDRDLVIPPCDGQVWGKFDLEGADSWTVAGQMVTLGDDTMFKDLKAGLKPAMILALARHCGEHLISAKQEELVPLLKKHKDYFKKTAEGKSLYETCKAVSHGTNYMMQAKTMHVTVFRKSKGELYIPIRQCEQLRLLYLKRYRGMTNLYEHIPTLLERDGYLDAPSGMRRLFFGRSDNVRTRAALSFLPQNNTAYSTDRALVNLFLQPYNRRPDGLSLIIELLNQVHDECDVAFYKDEASQAARIFKQASDLESEIWGVKFQIPFEPNYGENWGNCETDLYQHL